MNSWALGERLWKNWPPAPEAQSFPWGEAWERQQGWERRVVGGSAGGRGRRNCRSCARGCSEVEITCAESGSWGGNTVVLPVQMGDCVVFR